LFDYKNNYIFAAVSAAAESTTVVSTTVESTTVESTAVESAVSEPEPLQAANEVAIAKATNAILKFFILIFFKSDYIVLVLIHENIKGNPLFSKKTTFCC